MFKRKTQPKSLKDEVADVVHAVSDVVRQGSANAIDAAAPRLRDASVKLQDAASQVRPRVDRINEQIRPRIEELGKQGRAQYDHLSAESLARFDDAKHRFTDEIAPQATERAGAVASSAAGLLAAAQTPKFVDDLAVRVTGDKKAMKKARKALNRASKDIAKNTRVKKSGNGFGMTMVWILAIGGLAGIAYYVWKKAQPVEDPWSTPLPANRPADARPVGSVPASQQDAVGPTVTETPVPAAKIEATDDVAADPDSADVTTDESDVPPVVSDTDPNAPKH